MSNHRKRWGNMDAEIFLKKVGTHCYLYAMFDSDMVALSKEFEYSLEELQSNVNKMVDYLKGLGFDASTTLS